MGRRYWWTAMFTRPVTRKPTAGGPALTSGPANWHGRLRGVGKGGSVTFADGMLYCYSEDGTVGLIRPSPEKCEVVSSFKVSQGDGPHWAHLVVANGRLFLRHGTALMCYDLAAR